MGIWAEKFNFSLRKRNLCRKRIIKPAAALRTGVMKVTENRYFSVGNGDSCPPPPPNLLVVFVELWPLSNVQYPFLYKITKYHSQVELRHTVLHRYDGECDRYYWYSGSAPAHQDGKHGIRLTGIQMPLPHPPAPSPSPESKTGGGEQKFSSRLWWWGGSACPSTVANQCTRNVLLSLSRGGGLKMAFPALLLRAYFWMRFSFWSLDRRGGPLLFHKQSVKMYRKKKKITCYLR